MKTKELAIYFLLAYLISWIIWAPYWLPSFGFNTRPILPYQHGIGGFGPMISAFITTAIFGGKADIRKLWRSLTAWRPVSWLLIAVLTPPALALVGGLVAWMNNGHFPDFSRFGYSDEFPELGAAGFLVYNVVFFGFGEETGWRGFALPRLQGRYNALAASLILSVFWAGWHIPIFTYRPGYVSMDFAGMVGWYFSILTGTILLTWLFNGSRGSILACALFHGLIDVVFMTDYADPGMMQYIGIAVTLLGIALLFLFGWRNLSKGDRIKTLT